MESRIIKEERKRRGEKEEETIHNSSGRLAEDNWRLLVDSARGEPSIEDRWPRGSRREK